MSDFDVGGYCDRIERVLDFLYYYADNVEMEGEEAALATIKAEADELTGQTKQLKDLFFWFDLNQKKQKGSKDNKEEKE